MEKIGLLLFLAVLVKEDSSITDSSLGIITAINDSNWCWMHNKWEMVRIVNAGYRRKEDIDSLETVTLNN